MTSAKCYQLASKGRYIFQLKLDRMKNRCRQSGRLITDVTEIVADLLSVTKQITAKVFEKIQKSRDL
jgi:hypothetical protein